MNVCDILKASREEHGIVIEFVSERKLLKRKKERNRLFLTWQSENFYRMNQAPGRLIETALKVKMSKLSEQ